MEMYMCAAAVQCSCPWRALPYWAARTTTEMMLAIIVAGRLAGGFVVDAFTGAGGNAVQLAGACAAVLGIDTSAPRLAAAAHNAALYGVRGRLDLLAGDVLALLPRVRDVRCGSSRRPPERLRGIAYVDMIVLALLLQQRWVCKEAARWPRHLLRLHRLKVGTCASHHPQCLHYRQMRCSCRRRGAARRTRRRAAALPWPPTWAAWAWACARCWRPRAVRCAPAAAAWPCTCRATRCSRRRGRCSVPGRVGHCKCICNSGFRLAFGGVRRCAPGGRGMAV